MSREKGSTTTRTVRYDAEQRLGCAHGRRCSTWKVAGRLPPVHLPGVTATTGYTATYDAQDRRIEKAGGSGLGAQLRTRYVYDGQQILGNSWDRLRQ